MRDIVIERGSELQSGDLIGIVQGSNHPSLHLAPNCSAQQCDIRSAHGA